MTNKELHPLTEKIKPLLHDHIGCYIGDLGYKVDTIIVEWLEGVYKKLQHNYVYKTTSQKIDSGLGHCKTILLTADEEGKRYVRDYILSLPSPQKELEEELAECLKEVDKQNMITINNEKIYASHIKHLASRILEFLKSKGKLVE